MPFCHDPWDKDPPIALASCPYYRRRWPPAPVHRWGAPTEREGCKTWSISFGSFILRLCDDFFIMFVYERAESFRVQFLHECPWMSMNRNRSFQQNRKHQKAIPVIRATHMSGCSPRQLNARSLWPRAIPMLASQLQLLYVGWQIIVATSGNTWR